MTAPVGKAALPMGVSLDQQNFNRWVLNTLEDLQKALIPPTHVTNFRVTPQPGGNLIDFTRSDGDSYTLYINTTPSIDLAQRVRLGGSNRYTHAVGIGGVKYYYAIKPVKGSVNGEVGEWVSGTTLGLTVPAAPVEPPPATEFPFTDQQTNSVEIAVPSNGDYTPL